MMVFVFINWKNTGNCRNVDWLKNWKQ